MTLVALLGIIALESNAWSAQEANIIDVRTMGARGDGETDDRAAIQKAIDLAESSGRPVYFPAGDYFLRPFTEEKDAFVQMREAYRCLKIDSDNVEMRFDKNAWLVVNAEDQTHGNRGVAVLYLAAVSNVLIDGINIRNLRDLVDPSETPPGFWPRQDLKPLGQYYNAIEVGGPDQFCSNVIIKNAEVKFLGHGIRFWGARGCHVYDSYLHHCKDTAFNGHGASRDCTIERSKVTHSGDGNCTFYGNNLRCGIRNCYLTGTNQVGVIESSHYSFIEDCYFDGSDGSVNNGPIVNRSRHATVRGNKIVGVHYGIVLRETDIPDAGGVPNWGALVEGNQIIDTQERIKKQIPCGLWIEYAAGVLVSNNTFMRTRKTGSATPCEIRILDRRSPAAKGLRNEGVRIFGNQFLLMHHDARSDTFADTHYVLKNDTGYTLDGLAFNNNTIVAQQSHGWGRYLIELGSVRKFQFIGNTSMAANDPSAGPAHLLTGDRIEEAAISQNTCSYVGGDLMFLPECSKVVISNNVATGAGADPGTWLHLGKAAKEVIVSGNIVRSSYFIRADSPPKKCVITNNVADYDCGEPYLNMDDDSNIVRDNILTGF